MGSFIHGIILSLDLLTTTQNEKCENKKSSAKKILISISIGYKSYIRKKTQDVFQRRLKELVLYGLTEEEIEIVEGR